MRKQAQEPATRLLHALVRELYQAEVSALVYARREAARLGDAPPSNVMLDVGRHAERALEVLPPLMEARKMKKRALPGAAVGLALSAVRRFGLDFVLGPERSYRFTLLGMRHAIDLVYELQHLAGELGDDQLADFCRTWLEQRVPRVTAVERQLPWFVTHVGRALQGATR